MSDDHNKLIDKIESKLEFFRGELNNETLYRELFPNQYEKQDEITRNIKEIKEELIKIYQQLENLDN